MQSPEREVCAGRARVEGNSGSGREDHVGPAPGLIVDERPAMAGARRILGKQDVAGSQPEVPALPRLEIQRAAQRNDELARRCGVPGERAARFRLLKGDAGRCQLAAQQVAALAWIEGDVPFLEVRLLVVAGPQVNASDHGSTPGSHIGPARRAIYPPAGGHSAAFRGRRERRAFGQLASCAVFLRRTVLRTAACEVQVPELRETRIR